jgi:amino acid transporter
MQLTETGESRVNGYLFVLERSLKTFLARDVVRDAVREIESHLRERIVAADPSPDERAALERILTELGPPLRVAQAYSAERTIDEAVTTGRFVPMVRAVNHMALTTVAGFFTALGLFASYLGSIGFIALAFLKPIFPNNVGVWVHDATPDELSFNFGAAFPALPHQHVTGGYWVMPIALFLGLGGLVLTHRGARAFLTKWRKRNRPEL